MGSRKCDRSLPIKQGWILDEFNELMKWPLRSSLLCLVLLSVHSYADTEPAELSVGLNLSLDFQSYKGREMETSVLPTAFYDGDFLYAEGDQAGLNLYRDTKNKLRLYAYYDGTMYHPSGSLSQLDERQWSVLVGTSYMYTSDYGAFKLSAAQDILSRSRGAIANLSYIAAWETGSWTLYPELGLQWNSSKYNQYYFGVSSEESKRSGIKSYQLDSGVYPYAGLAVDYELNKHWNIYTTYKVNYLSDDQYQSPMTKKRVEFEPGFGVNYTF